MNLPPANLHPALRIAIYKFTSKPTVTSIRPRNISGLEIPAIIRKPNLEKLHLGGVRLDPSLPPSIHFDPESAQDSFSQGSKAPFNGPAFLQKLDLWGSGDVFKQLLKLTSRPGATTSLTRLTTLQK